MHNHRMTPQQRWIKNHPEEYRAMRARWRDKNRDRLRRYNKLYQRKRRAKMRNGK